MGLVRGGNNGPLVRQELGLVDLGNIGVATNVNFNRSSDLRLTLTASVQLTLFFPTDTPGSGFRLSIIQGGAGGFTPTLVANVKGNLVPVKAVNGVLTLTPAPGSEDLLVLANRETDVVVLTAPNLVAL